MPITVAKYIVGVVSKGLVIPIIHLEDVLLGMYEILGMWSYA